MSIKMNPQSSYTNQIQMEILSVEMNVLGIIGQMMAGNAGGGSSAGPHPSPLAGLTPLDSIGSGQASGSGSALLEQEMLVLLEELLMLMATLGGEAQPGNSQSGDPGAKPKQPTHYHSGQGGSPNMAPAGGAKPLPQKSDVKSPSPSPSPSSSASSSIGPYTGETSPLSSYSGPGHTVAAGNLKPEDIDAKYGTTIQNDVDKYNKQYGTSLTKAFVEGVVYQESKGDPLAAAPDQGGKGLMQVSSDIGSMLSPGGNQYDPNVSLDSGIHLLAMMDGSGSLPAPINGFYGSTATGAGGDLQLLAAKYQGGANATSDALGYGAKVMGWMNEYLNGTAPPQSY